MGTYYKLQCDNCKLESISLRNKGYIDNTYDNFQHWTENQMKQWLYFFIKHNGFGCHPGITTDQCDDYYHNYKKDLDPSYLVEEE